MIFDMQAFLQFLWREYDYQFMTDIYGYPYDDTLPKTPDSQFEDWIEGKLSKLQMISYFAEFLAEQNA